MNTAIENVKSKLVFDMRACRLLLKRGHRVVDCKPLKTDRDKTVLIFEETESFLKDLEEITAELKKKDMERKAARQPIEKPEMAD